MYLVEVFIPTTSESRSLLPSLQERLVERFGGVTAYSRAPAKGVDLEQGKPVSDEITILEVMTPSLDQGWWAVLRARLEHDLQQREILVRVSEVQKI